MNRLQGSGWAAIVAGCPVPAAYGLMGNTVKWEFSRLLGAYVAVSPDEQLQDAGAEFLTKSPKPVSWMKARSVSRLS